MDITRKPDFQVDDCFIKRWSPRSFSRTKIPEEIILSLFEAARWSPSCFNDQPWHFFYSDTETSLNKFLSALAPSNQIWAQNAPLLCFLTGRKNFRHNGAANFHNGFDCGAAWMAFTLQANKHNLYTHAMAGFDKTKAYEILEISPSEFEIYVAIAAGFIDKPEKLPLDIAAKEKMNSRIPTKDIFTKK